MADNIVLELPSILVQASKY